jgi:hypothetical protein
VFRHIEKRGPTGVVSLNKEAGRLVKTEKMVVFI